MTWDVATVSYAAARWLGYLAIFAIAGAAAFRWIVLPGAVRDAGGDPAPLAHRATLIARLAAVLLAIILLVRLYFQVRSLIEPDEPVTLDLVRLVMSTAWGRGWLTQGAAALVAMIGWRMIGRRPEAPAAGWLALAGSVGLVLSSPLTGHAVGLPAAGRIGYPLTVLHLGAGAAWLGTLGVLAVAALGARRADPVPVPALIASFSRLALRTGIVTIGAGLIVAWRYVGTIGALTGTEYGRTLLIKVALLVGVALTGAWNWRVALPRLLRGEGAPIRRSAYLELLIAALLLAVTAVLVSLGAPGEHAE